MEDTNILREKINSCESNLRGQKFEDVVKIFIESLYEVTSRVDSYSIKNKRKMDGNLKKFMNASKKWVKVYASNIKRDYKDESKKLLDIENEEANIYLYIIESIYYFYIKHCNSNLELFKEYIRNNNKTYINTENKEYTFNKFMYMSMERKIKEENKLLGKSLEKGNMDLNGVFSKFEVDATVKLSDGQEKEIDLYSMGLFTLLETEDIRSEEQILKDNIREMIRIQDRLLTVLTRSQMEFVTTEIYGCYYDKDKEDFIMKMYTKQQKNQYLNQISKRINRDIRPFFVKKHSEKYIDEMIRYRRKNRKKVDATPRDLSDYLEKHTTLRTEGIIEIKQIEGEVTEHIPYGATKWMVNEEGIIEYEY